MWFVSVIALGLARWEINKFNNNVDYEILCHATILHDTAEPLTGDILSGIKRYNDDMHRAVKVVEEGIYTDKLEKTIPRSWRQDYRKYILDGKSLGIEGKILEAADTIDALFECVEELQLGNERFKMKVLEVCSLLVKTELQSVKYFLKYSLQDLGLPLDTYGTEMLSFIDSLEFDDK
jgi:5'-deoxynucleotidase YfbR-like HD superfamily hydrolase